MRLRNEVALVTGAGFGAEIARPFAAEGAFVAVVDLNEAGARSISTEIGNAASSIRCDVAVGPEVRNAVETTQKIFGRLEIVVNNAGTTHRNKPMLEVTEAEFDKVYVVNVKSIFRMALAAVPAMHVQGSGVFLNIGSTAGLRPRPGLTWYNGSKGAVNLLTKSMAVELAPDHIRVTVSPL
jgi:3-oxoacyl-[acyl-carrier protein] reductase